MLLGDGIKEIIDIFDDLEGTTDWDVLGFVKDSQAGITLDELIERYAQLFPEDEVEEYWEEHYRVIVEKDICEGLIRTGLVSLEGEVYKITAVGVALVEGIIETQRRITEVKAREPVNQLG